MQDERDEAAENEVIEGEIVEEVENRAHWKPGQSGNPEGRPAQTTALAEVLRDIGAEKAQMNAPESLTYRETIGFMLWDAVRDGVLRFGDGRLSKLSNKEWLDIVKWVQQQIDPPKVGTREVRYIGVANDPNKYVRDDRPIVFTWGEDDD
jgi:hypothetical protein